MTANFAALQDAVVRESVATRWADAVMEWEVVGVEYDHAQGGVCVCGKTELVELFTIVNQRNGARLFPIGSVCVNKFGRSDLDQEVNVLKRFLHLREAITTHEWIELTSEYFSRALIRDLYDQGAFPPNQWNGGDGWGDCDFLLKMFNKHDKEAITAAQNRKIRALLGTIKTFVLADERLM